MFTKVLRNVMWLGSGEAAVKGGLLLVTVLIARGAGPTGVGTFSIAYAAALIGIMILAFGQQEVLIREVARAPEHVRWLLDRSQRLQRRLAVWLLPAFGVGILAVAESELRLSLLAFVPYVLLRTATVTSGAAFKGMDRMDVEVRARGIEVVLALVCIAAASVLGWPIWTVGVAFSFGAAAGLTWISGRAKRLARPEPEANFVDLALEGLPFMVLAVLGQLLINADRFLLEILGVARTEIGYWGAAGSVVWALVAVPQLIAVATYPSFARIAKEGGTWRRAGAAAFGGGVVVGGVCALLIRAFAAPITNLLFGAEFSESVPLIQRLSLVLPGAFSMMVVGVVFAAWRKQMVAMWVLSAAFFVSVFLNLWWIPRLGPIACANAAVVSYSAAATVVALLLVAPVRYEEEAV